MHDVRYGPAHRRLRAQLASPVRAGLAVCARCGEPIDPREPWISAMSPVAAALLFRPGARSLQSGYERWPEGVAHMVSCEGRHRWRVSAGRL